MMLYPRCTLVVLLSLVVSVTSQRETNHWTPGLPYFLGGSPSNEQEHSYSEGQRGSEHTAEGEGLHRAVVGERASFTIQLAHEPGDPPADQWNVHNGLFIYVWIANQDQIFTAEVVNEGNGLLTASYVSSFPGEYLIHIEAIVLGKKDEGRPIKGSPFELTITGDPALNVDELPTCGTEEENSIMEAFWKEGSWVSSNIASATHGVGRDGWVFQPKTCVYDMFSYDDLMLLAGMSEPTWLLVLGGSVQRGLFLGLVDMMLAQGQKDDFDTSVIQKCWGYADVTVGNLRVTYQDMRLYVLRSREDSVECNNEKLASGSTAAFLRSSRQFLRQTVFRDEHPWPSVIVGPVGFSTKRNDPNFATTVLLEALPKTWQGKLIMVDHMSGFGASRWRMENPTRTALDDIGATYRGGTAMVEGDLAKLENYRDGDSRVEFMSLFPMNQAKLYENQHFGGDRVRKYGSSQHYHHVSRFSHAETCSGARMVFSSIIEMLANIMIAKAVGTKAALHENAAATPGIGMRSAAARRSFQVCSDCPANLVPFHVKSVPEPTCETVTSLQANAPTGQVWNNEMCPDWCMATQPVEQTPTESGMVDVRVCSLHD